MEEEAIVTDRGSNESSRQSVEREAISSTYSFTGSQCQSYQIVTYDLVKTYEYVKSQATEDVLIALGDKLKLFIDSLFHETIDAPFVQNFMKSYIDSSRYRTKEEKELYFKMETLMKAAVVYYLIQKNPFCANPVQLYGPAELMQAYPQFQLEYCDRKEVVYLMNFCNAMRVAVRIIPPRLKKRILIAICAKLEGSGKSYITGGCQHHSTERRVIIYEQESGVKPIPRPPRRPPTEEQIQERKRRRQEAAAAAVSTSDQAISRFLAHRDQSAATKPAIETENRTQTTDGSEGRSTTEQPINDRAADSGGPRTTGKEEEEEVVEG